METNQVLKNSHSQTSLTLRKPMLGVMEAQDRQEIRNQLALFKEKGVIVFEKVLSVPSHERINALVQLPQGRSRVSAALSGSIVSAFQALNLRVGMNTEQILDLADEIIDQSQEDNLALEDVLLFLQQMITGKAGKIYDRMDIPTFFELFETYREDRYQSLKAIQEQSQANYKALGDPTRVSEGSDKEKDSMRLAMADHLRAQFPQPTENKTNESTTPDRHD